MNSWPKHPIIYEINTLTWLSDLSRRHGRRLTLATVPDAEWDALAAYGFDAVWLMGVWERSPAGREIALATPGLLDEFRKALPDFQIGDVAGSPYCVRNYVVDAALGGPAGLAAARENLQRRGLRLILDFVPNHVAPDHPWTAKNPDYFIHGEAADLAADPNAFIEIGGAILARGRDPFFPPWPDVVQLNACNADLRKAVAETLAAIARQCDGVRCDMAMLCMTSVFAKTWGKRAGPLPPTEYWADAIGATKQAFPHFLFIAEAYWDMEWELQRQGFDFCYDKRLYDRLRDGTAEGVRSHLMADPAFSDKLIRFIENHDEPRAAAAFPGRKEFAAALAMSTVPGAKLFHEGQFEGRKIRQPVFLGRRPDEPPSPKVAAFYKSLMGLLRSPSLRLRRGVWRQCAATGWPDDDSWRNVVAWSVVDGENRWVMTINLSDATARARIHPQQDNVADIVGKVWLTTDALTGREYERNGDEIVADGLFVELPAWGAHLFGHWKIKDAHES